MSNIAKWLSVFNALSWNYPKPDSFISLTSSGNVIWYQWKSWSNVLGMIKMNANWWKDPLEKSYYTYSVNYNSSKFQILGFLEDWGNTALSYIPISLAADYSQRFSITKWDGIWILLSSWTLDPVENQISATFSWVDLSSTNTAYTMKFDKETSIAGTWIILKTAIVSPKGLIAYWDMESLSWNTIYDMSANLNTWTLISVTQSGWKIWKALSYDGVSWWYMLVASTGSLKLWSKSFTISWMGMHNNYDYPKSNFMIKQSSLCYINWASNAWFDIGHWYVSEGINLCVRDVNNNQMRGNLIFDPWYRPIDLIWKWIHYTFIFDRDKGIVVAFINGRRQSNTLNLSAVTGTIDNSNDMLIGAMYWWKTDWMLDEIRIYNRAISDYEATALYNSVR
jgi:hypothetical protein